MLPVGAHERYLYPLLAFLLPAALLDRRWLMFYVAVSTTFFLNLFVAAPPVQDWSERWIYSAFGAWIGAVNVALFVGMTLVLLRGAIRGDGETAGDTASALPDWQRAHPPPVQLPTSNL
jgi:hypothetical protein